MIKILELDIENTLEIFNKCEKYLKKGSCYYNTFKVVTEVLLLQFHNNIIKIGYCYAGGDNHQLIRHCVIITNENKVIDASCLLKYSVEQLKNYVDKYNIRYYVFAELNHEEYMDMIEQENLMPELQKSLKDYEKEIVEYMDKNKLDVNTYDFSKYIAPILIEKYIK